MRTWRDRLVVHARTSASPRPGAVAPMAGKIWQQSVEICEQTDSICHVLTVT